MSVFSDDYIPGSDPFKEFDIWLKKAKELGEPEPTTMALSTISKENRPRGRIVLFKGITRGSFTFFTNYNSHKAEDIAYCSHVALTFHWKTLELQLRIEGSAEKSTRSESEHYFSTRPRESQIGAWSSLQSQSLKDHTELNQRRLEFEKKYQGKDVPCPPHWGGYLVKPNLFEFWILRRGRLHDRFLYTPHDQASWSKSLLYP